jgi:CBS domain-containing protein/Flp pilus assembly pilin Flp
MPRDATQSEEISGTLSPTSLLANVTARQRHCSAIYDLLQVCPSSHVDEIMPTRKRNPTNRRGTTSVEYAVILTVLASACITALAFLGRSTNESFEVVLAAVDEKVPVRREIRGEGSDEHSLSELVESKHPLMPPLANNRRWLLIAFNFILNAVLWFILIARKRREKKHKEQKREAQRLARKSTAEVIQQKRRHIMRVLDESFGDFADDKLKVRTLMSQEITICRPSNSVRTIVAKILEEQLQVAWVCDREDRLVGVLSHSDVRRNASGSVGSFMTPDLISVGPDAPLSEALKLFVDHGVPSLPVVAKDGSMHGVLPRVDVLLLLQSVQVTLHSHRGELSNVFTGQRKAKSITEIIATSVEEAAPLEEVATSH